MRVIDRDPRYGLRRAGAATLAALALFVTAKEGSKVIDNAFSSGNNTYQPASDPVTTTLREGWIAPNTHLRTDPTRIESASISNSCAAPIGAAVLGDIEVTIEEGRDGNGPWAGIPLDRLPADIQQSCSKDADGTVWVANRYVHEDASIYLP